MRLHRRSFSKVNLLDVLKRKKSNLAKFLSDSGIVTYELLVDRCNSMGVVPPEEDVFFVALGRKQEDVPNVSSPAEGVVILEPPTLISEKSGKPVTEYPDLTIDPSLSEESQVTDAVTQSEIDTAGQFRQKKKKV